MKYMYLSVVYACKDLFIYYYFRLTMGTAFDDDTGKLSLHVSSNLHLCFLIYQLLFTVIPGYVLCVSEMIKKNFLSLLKF